MKPIRIQLSRDRGWKMPPNTVKVDRTSKVYGNDFRIGHPVPKVFLHMDFDHADTFRYMNEAVVPDAAEAVRLYWRYGLPNAKDIAALRGKSLACWCKPGDPCHADVLLELANR